MKKRGLSSPDCGDALALTFAHPVHISRFEDKVIEARAQDKPYDPFTYMTEAGL
jgi:hypothetical protein